MREILIVFLCVNGSQRVDYLCRIFPDSGDVISELVDDSVLLRTGDRVFISPASLLS